MSECRGVGIFCLGIGCSFFCDAQYSCYVIKKEMFAGTVIPLGRMIMNVSRRDRFNSGLQSVSNTSWLHLRLASLMLDRYPVLRDARVNVAIKCNG